MSFHFDSASHSGFSVSQHFATTHNHIHIAHIQRNLTAQATTNMKNTRRALITPKLVMFASASLLMCGFANAATVLGTGGWEDGNQGQVFSVNQPFTITATDSIFIATVYTDTNNPVLTNVRFGDGGGIGSGDVAPTLSFSDDRLNSFVFVNPNVGTGSFQFDNVATGNGIGVIFYEIGGASSSFTTATGSNSITTSTSNELIVSFAGRNSSTAPSINSNSIFTATDEVFDDMRGAGSISSASAIAPAVGSNNIQWNSANDGRIAYSFQVIPEPATALLGGLGFLMLLRRRR